MAVAFAAAGVAWLTWLAGSPPWIALMLALSFGLYGLIRKTVAVDSLTGLGAETLLLAPLALVWLVYEAFAGGSSWGRVGATVDVLLVASGVVTAVPLVLFAYGARRIPYSTIGLIQYLGPTLQLMLGIFFFGETFPRARAAGFALIWTALAIYAADGLVRSLRRPAAG